MLRLLTGFLATGVAMAVLDALWLTQIGPRLYRPALDAVLAETPRLAPAVTFYLLYVVGVMILAVSPAATWRQAATNGAVLGLVAYGTYDLTSQAVLQTWSTRITVIDMAWGAALTTIAAVSGFSAMRLIPRG